MASRTTRSKATPKKTPPKVKQEESKVEEKPKVEVKEPVKEPVPGAQKEVKEEIKEEEEEVKEDVTEETAENGEPEVEDDGNEEEVDEDKLLDGNDDEEEVEDTELKEGEEETKEEEEEKEKEKEEEEGSEEKKEETTEEDEKKAAEKKAAEKKAAEKKAADEKKNKMYIPTAGKYNQDEHVYMRLRSVVVGPLELEDLQNDIVKDMANKAEEFFYRFHFIEKEEKHVGHIEFRFKSIAEADEMIETLKTIKEGVVVKRLVGGMNAAGALPKRAKFDKDVRGINDEAEKEKYKRIVAVGGVPESATQEKLQEVFPDARVKFIALKPDGTPKWYAYLELDDEKTAKKIAEQYKEVEFEGEKLYCRCLRPGKPEDPEYETNPDHVLTDEERKKVQARINNMKYKLNGGAILRPLDAQRLKRRVNQLSGLLRSSHNRRKDGSKEPGDEGGAKPAAKTGGPPAKRNDPGPGNRRTAMRGTRGRGGMQGPGIRPSRGGRQGGWQGGSGWQGGPGPSPNRNMGNANFRGNQRAPAMPMGSPRQQGGFYGGRGGSPARSAGGGGGGRSNMYNNPQQTANAVNMLVGLTNLLSQARNQGGQGSGSQGVSGQGGYNQQPGSGNYGSGGSGYSGGYDRGDNYERGSYGGGGSGYGGGSSYSGGGSFNNGGNYSSGGYSGGGYGGGFSSGGGFGNSGGNFNNRKRTYSGNRRGQGTPAKQSRRFGGWN